MVGTEWIEARPGTFVLLPGNVTHDFENRGSERAGMLNVSAPGNFEERMPGIAKWFVERPLADSHVLTHGGPTELELGRVSTPRLLYQACANARMCASSSST
jgi:hypothetical protein